MPEFTPENCPHPGEHVKWNRYNRIVQCHQCGEEFVPKSSVCNCPMCRLDSGLSAGDEEKFYTSERNAVEAGPVPVYRRVGDIKELLPTRNNLVNHSPDGFQWGFAGSGPAQLALAILADALGDDVAAVEHHVAFKNEVIAEFPREKVFMMSHDKVLEWYAKHLGVEEDSHGSS